VAVVAVPTWTVVDRITVPHLATSFLIVRLLCDVPMALAMFALVGVSWVALALAVLALPGGLTLEDLAAVTVYLGTASATAALTHHTRRGPRAFLLRGVPDCRA
jgi:hypothetical protein